MLAIDAVALVVLWLGVYDIRAALEGKTFFGHAFAALNPRILYSAILPFLVPFWLLILARCRFYAHHERIADLNRMGPAFWAVFGMVLVVGVANFVGKNDFGRTIIAGFASATLFYLWASRTCFRAIKHQAVERGHGRVRVLVVGAGELGRETLKRVRVHPDIGFQVVGFVSPYEKLGEEDIEGFPVLGTLDDLETLIQRHRIEEVFFSIPEMEEEAIFGLIHDIQSKTSVVCKVVANMLYVIVNRAKVDEVTGLPVIAFRGSVYYPAERALKRLLDIVLALGASLVMVPFALLFGALIRIDSPGPALFAHERVGLDGRLFRMWKFRTMRTDCEPYAEAPLDQSDSRVTRFGRFLRLTSLDEIPQMINVLKGEMSFVGPRPEMPFIVETYSEWQRARLRVKPGVTGLWQVAGRKNLPLHENLEYDYYYVCNLSLALDAEILIRTVPAVLLSRGAF